MIERAPLALVNTTKMATELTMESNSAHATNQRGQSKVTGLLIGIPLGCGLLLIILGLSYVIWRRHRSRPTSSATLSKAVILPGVNKGQNQAGVIQSEKIEFVLPYTSAEPTEEEASEQEPGHFRYSYIHVAPPGGGANNLAVPGQPKKGGSIAPALYFSSEGEEELDTCYMPNAKLGKIGFSVRYKGQHEQLKVMIIGASDLPTKRRKGVSNAHVKVTLLPDKYPKFFTSVQKNTQDPVYNQEFTMFLKPEMATVKILKITMCDFDKFSRRIAIGHVFLPLKNLGIQRGSKESVLLGEVWKNLVPKYLETEEIRGEISLSLCYNSDTRNLRLGIHKVKNLNSKQDDKEIACLYAKVTLFEDGKVIKTRKTSAKRKTFEPDFAETFNIKMSRDRIQNVYCMVSVCSRNRYGTRKVIGRTQIGPYTHVSGPGADHWNDAFQSPKSTVTQWHVLR